MSTHEAPRVGGARGRAVALVLLSLASGAIDAFAFLALSGTFTANMTGNLVLVGLFTRPEYAASAACAATAILVFAAALFAGFRVTAGAPRDDRRTVRRLLVPSLVSQALVVAVWPFLVPAPPLIAQCAILALSAAALGLQTVTAKRMSDVDGVTTTYVTGTLTSTMQALAEGRRHGQLLRIVSIAGLPVGAVAGTALVAAVPPLGPLLALLLSLAAGVLLVAAVRREPQRV